MKIAVENRNICNKKTMGERDCISPQAWKLARVTPIYKTGSKTNVSNCKPISVLSDVSRILEKIVHDQLMEYIKGYSKLFESIRISKTAQHSSMSTECYRPMVKELW